MDDHDNGYKHLFAHTRMARDLLLGFGTPAWVQELDLDTLTMVPGSHVADDLRCRHSDVVWRVQRQQDGQALYLLLEFQSSVDPFMALRTLIDSALLHQDLIRSNALGASRQLPAVLPVVLYNGEARWRASQELFPLIEAPPPGLAGYQPDQKFLLVDEGALAETDLTKLEPLRNVAAILFRMENSRTPGDLQKLVALLTDWLSEPEHAGLRRAFTEWLRRVLLPRRFPGVRMPELQELQEVNTMLRERVKEWTRAWREQGLAQGLEEGVARGEQAVLTRLLRRRFGDIPDAYLRRMDSAGVDELDLWADRILDAETPQDIFR